MDEVIAIFSIDSVTAVYYDCFNVYVVPFICSIGLIINLISIYVLLKTGLKEQIFKYMLVSSLMDFWFLILHLFKLIVLCGTLCPYGNEPYVKAFELYFQLFIGNLLTTLSCLLDITVSLDRMFSFDSWYFKIFRKFSFRTRCIVLSLISVFVNFLIYPLSRKVDTTQRLNNSNSEYYTIKSREWDSNIKLLIELISILCSILRGVYLCLIVILINIIIIFKLKAKANAKNKILPNFSTNKRSKLSCLEYLF